MPRALIVWGGWEGHRPREMAGTVAELLGTDGYDTIVTHDYEALGGSDIGTMDLVVPLITNDEIDREIVRRLALAVRAGTGLGGPHLPATSFRQSVDYHFILGSQWVSHPGNVIDFRVEVTEPNDPIVSGIGNFDYRSEQYYMHVDPSVEVLATTTFTGEYDAATTGVVMPVAYKRRVEAGRVFYTALGHSPEELYHPQGREILRRGLRWATRGAD